MSNSITIPMNERKRMGSAMKKRRRALSLTAADLAKGVGCSFQHIDNVEHGRCSPSLPIYVAICRELKFGPLPLFGGGA